MKKVLATLLVLLLFCLPVAAREQAKIYPFDYAFEEYWYDTAVPAATFSDTLPLRAAILTEASTGKVLYAQNETERLPIASVTKTMSTLLVLEAIDGGKLALTDTVTVGEDAAAMGGSQVYLEAGEQMSVDDLLKALIVVSANDATVALAEHLCGSEQSFVAAMNERAAQLGLENTHYANCHGLNEDNHYSCARDIAVITRELLKHPLVLNYTTIWMDTIRNGAFGLANTNKLIRFYRGANGMKTGFTDLAKYCLSGTAERDGMQLIAVVLGADTSDIRFASAKKLLDFGFANYAVVVPERLALEPVETAGGERPVTAVTYTPPSLLTAKGAGKELRTEATWRENITSPVVCGDVVGEIAYYDGETLCATVPILAAEDNPALSYGFLLGNLFRMMFGFLSA